MKALAEVMGAAGLAHPREIKPWHLHIRHPDGRILRGDAVYLNLKPCALLSVDVDKELAHEWSLAQANSFDPAPVV